MTSRSQSIPSFLGGINQQPELYRSGNSVTESTNINYSPSDGAGKRYPTSHVAQVSTAELSGARLISFERDEEDYRIVVTPSGISAFAADGSPVLVRSLSEGAPYTPDLSYLSGAGFFDIREQKIADSIFILNRRVTVAGTPGRLAPSWTENGEAGVFIRQANYGVSYSITVETAALGAPVTVQYIIPSSVGLNNVNPTDASAFSATATAAQAAGSAPFVLAFDLNQASELRPTINAVDSPTSDWEWDPTLREATYIGSSMVAGDAVRIGRREGTLNWVLRTDLIARILRERLDALTGISVETTVDGSSFRVHSTSPLLRFEATDSVGGTYMIGWTDSVSRLSDLPVVFKHGAVVRVRSASSTNDDDYYVTFGSEEWQRESGLEADFDSYSGFGPGTWIETVSRGLDSGGIDETTMPHVLRRTVDDGTVTGTPGTIYFDWQPFDGWLSRRVGDSVSAREPSFIGNRITDIFLHQGRLGFLSNTQVSLSDSGDVGNFWPTTLLSVPDSDAIDIGVTVLDGDTLWNAIPFDRQLLVFSDRGQAVIVGDPILSKNTIQAQPLAQFEAFASVRPVFTGRSVFFAWPNRSYAGVREFFPGDQERAFSEIGITMGAHELIPKDVRKLAASSSESIMAVSTDSGRMFVYRYLRSGVDLAMAAWGEWDFNSGQVVDIAFDQETMFLLITRGGRTFLEQIELGSGQVDEGLPFVVYADRKLALGSGSYNINTDETSYFTPWLQTEDALVVYSPVTGEAETVSAQDAVSGTVRVLGDTTSKTLWVGELYDASMTLTRPVYYRGTQTSQTPTIGEIQTVRALKVSVENTGYLRAVVEYTDGDTSEEELLADFLDVSQFPDRPLTNEELFVGIHSPVTEFRVRLVNDTHLPFFLISGEWDVLADAKHVKV